MEFVRGVILEEFGCLRNRENDDGSLGGIAEEGQIFIPHLLCFLIPPFDLAGLQRLLKGGNPLTSCKGSGVGKLDAPAGDIGIDQVAVAGNLHALVQQTMNRTPTRTRAKSIAIGTGMPSAIPLHKTPNLKGDLIFHRSAGRAGSRQCGRSETSRAERQNRGSLPDRQKEPRHDCHDDHTTGNP